MKKKIISIASIAVFVLLAVLFVPVKTNAYDDGATKEYCSLTYKIMAWNRKTDDGVYDTTRVYFGKDRNKTVDELWQKEQERIRKESEYTEFWLDKTTAEKYETNFFNDIVITEIYSNCFFARPVVPMPYTIKLNGTLSEDWCVGDTVICTYENTYYDKENHRVECDFLTVNASNWQVEPIDPNKPGTVYKPVIYLYPEEETEVYVTLDVAGELTCTYPAYKDGWSVTAHPDGTLTDSDGTVYNYLYWEGDISAQYDISRGFCIKGEDTAKFLEYALEKLGLTRREANEFIVFWLPMMQNNPYNVISFQGLGYTDSAKLEISPEPDTLIRVFMTFYASEELVEIPEQELSAPDREGFVAVEWGGTELVP